MPLSDERKERDNIGAGAIVVQCQGLHGPAVSNCRRRTVTTPRERSGSNITMTGLVHTAIQNLFQQDVSTFADVVQRVGFDWSCIRSHATARPDLWALLVGLLCLSWYLYNYGFSKDQNATENLTLPAVQALAVVFTPTCGAWPSHLTSHFATARVLTSNRVQVNISDLWEQICCGNIEVRDSRDLSELVGGKMRSYGWRFKLSVDRSLWLQTARWITSHYFEPSQVI